MFFRAAIALSNGLLVATLPPLAPKGGLPGVARSDLDRLCGGGRRGDVIGGLAYVSNWYQIFIGAGYSASNDFAPLRHLWSLAVEEQFDLVWPIVMVAPPRKGSRRIADLAV